MNQVRRIAYESVRQAHHWKWKIGVPALGVILVTTALGRLGLDVPYLGGVAWLVLLSVTAWWFWDRLLKPLSSQEKLIRGDEWLARTQGTSSWVDILETAGRGAMRRKSHVMRPSLGRLTWWQRFRTPVTEYAVPLARVGWFNVYSPSEMWTLRLGGPRMGKSGSLAAYCVDAPGALVTTSTRTDLLTLTGPKRAQKGEIHVFNPSLYGGYASTVRWSLLVGCRDYATCQRRAADLIPTTTGDAERWDSQARRMLALLLHAAALTNRTVFDIVGWVAHPQAATGEVVAGHLAEATGSSAIALMREARQVFTTNDRTLTSITTSLMNALQWVSDERAAAIGDAPVDAPDLLDVEALVRNGRDSLYLISPAERGTLASLTGALTAEIAYQARIAAGEMPGGRLDPPLRLCLDEAALACNNIPLDQWSADMGGRGVEGHITAQSLAQLRDQWGEAGTEALLTNCGSVVLFGGLKGATDLERLSTLTGERLTRLDEDDKRYVPVMTPGKIAALREGEVLVIRALMAPMIGAVEFETWKRRDVRKAADTWEPVKAGAGYVTETARLTIVPDDPSSITDEPGEVA